MAFDAPAVLALAPFIGGAVWFTAAWARRARLRRAARWSADTVRAARAAGPLGPTAVSLAAFLGVVALAGPRWGEERIEAETRGLNLVLAVDISRSMLAEDAPGDGRSRLARAVREARRLTQDLDGDRLGLVAFAGASYILSPLSIDGSALALYLDALDPDVASQGGTALAPAIGMGSELLNASTDLSDRVLVIFTDGEAHDSLPEAIVAAQQLHAAGAHLILVAEGGRAPTRIPVRDDRGALLGYQQDDDGQVITTHRRDDVLDALADAAQGAIVSAELPDQAGAVRDLVASYKRSRTTETSTQRGRSRAWVPVLAAVMILLVQALMRRTAALVAVLLALVIAGPAQAQRRAPVPAPTRPRTAAERAWDRGDSAAARRAYTAELVGHQGDDTAWYNAGTAALAAGDLETARTDLGRAATSLDPEIRFRALFNEGSTALREAEADSTNRDAHLADAERVYREALLLKPHDLPAKWNLELAVRRRSGGGGGGGQSQRPPPNGGSGAPPSASGSPPPPSSAGGLSQSQADQILRSIGQEELRTRRENRKTSRRASEPGVKDW